MFFSRQPDIDIPLGGINVELRYIHVTVNGLSVLADVLIPTKWSFNNVFTISRVNIDSNIILAVTLLMAEY